jgi:hypothetical protein
MSRESCGHARDAVVKLAKSQQAPTYFKCRPLGVVLDGSLDGMDIDQLFVSRLLNS